MADFDVVALAHMRDGRLLLVRSRGKNGFYLPGGKPEPGESEIETLMREVREELGCSLDLSTVQYLTTTVAQAFGKPPGVQVAVKTYAGDLVGMPHPTSEVEELRYFTRREYQEMPSRAPAAEALMEKLVEQGLIDG